MEAIGLVDRIHTFAVFIDHGRRGLDTDGWEHEGRLSYEIGISGALEVFREVQTIGKPLTFVLSEGAFLQHELNFCNEADDTTKNSLSKAVQSFEDALRCLKTVENPASYRAAETTFPTDDKNRIKTFPRDAVHQACASHWTRLQNALSTPGLNMKEKAVLSQRSINMKTAQTIYTEKQRQTLEV
jgi:hypothetical protein